MPYVSRRFFLALFIYANLISLFFISNHVPGYASDNHQICDQKDVSIKKLPLTASSLFANITKFPDDVENKRLEALKQGIQFKLIGNNEQARCFFETAALIDAPSAMHQLGMLGAHDKVDWFILAFQVHWIQTGKHLPVSCNALEALRSSDKRAAIFLNDLTKRYPENGNHIHNLYNKAVQFLESLEEHYLSEQERIEKAFRCFSAIKDENGYRELARLLFNNKMGRHFSEEEQAEQAVAYALRSNDPIYLRNAGIYYNIGKVGKNLSPEERSNKAFSCFLDAKDPEAKFEAAVLLQEGKVKKPHAMKLAETYYLESKLPKAFLNLGILWRDGLLGSKQRYQNAIKFFLSSNLPVGKYNAAILYRDGLTGDNMPQSQRDEKAVSLLLEVESSLPLAKAVLGCMYRLAKKYAEAEKSLTAACEHNIASAFHNLGLMYHLSETGFTLSKWDREQKALSLFTKAFNLSGSTESKIQLEASKCQIAAMLINNTAGQQEGSQEERDKEAFRLLCECDGAESKLFKGSMLLEGRALLDLSEEVRYKSAQECFECSKTPDALHYLGIMYHFGKAGKELSKENRLNKAIELYRASDTLLAKADLGLLLYENPEAELSSPGKERDQVICELLQDSGTNIGKTGLGAMYIHGRAGKNLTQFERDQKAILLFNEAQTPAAYNNLAKLYIEERLGTDLPNSKRIQQAIDCFAKAIQPSGKFKEGCATAYLNLGLLYIIEEEIRDIGHALHLFHLAALAGIEQGAVYRDTLLKYCFVNEDFSSLANLKEIFFSHKNTASSSQINETSLQEKVLVNTNSKEGLGEKEVNESKFSQNSEIKISTNSSKDLKSLKKQLKQYNPDAKTKKRLFKKSLKNELTREEKSQLLSGDVKTSHNKIKIEFIGKAEKQYESWRKSNSYHASKIDDLIRVAFINPDSKRGKPEALDGDLAGWWSRRIDDEHRLVYKLTPDSILIKSCKKHYY